MKENENFRLALILVVSISILAGFLGIGPGFLLMPTLILVGFEPKKAAGINGFAVTPLSFSALLLHLSTAVGSPTLTWTLIAVESIGAVLGARITSLWIPSGRLKRIFGVLIVVMTAYTIYTMF